jgi:ribonuclease III
LVGAADYVERLLGHRFADPALLERALTHRSAGGAHNERLEFLGDGLLNFVLAETVFLTRSELDEGELTRLRASLARQETLAAIAARIGIGDHLRLGSGELKSGGFRRESILADALEALLGAIYLDGGFGAGRAACLKLYATEIATLPAALSPKDAKTRLQEFLQGQGRPLPRYEVLAVSGPPHRQQFTVACSLADGAERAEASGASRRAAEQAAAEALFSSLSEVRSA